MITIIHGEDTAVSRNYFYDLKQKYPDGTTLDGITISPTDLQQILIGEDLFGTKKTFFIENLFSKKKSPKEIDQFAEIVNKSGADVILWESKELTARQTGLLKGAAVKAFKIPATIFALLDNIKPDNGKMLIQEFRKTLLDKDAEFVLFMLERHIRTLLALSSVILGNEVTPESEKDPGQARMTISELSRMAPWQRGKMEKQAKMFTVEQLIQLHSQLFNIDRNMKTGGLASSLTNALDLFFLHI